MKVLALKADSGGCANYRIEHPARVVRDLTDWDITVADAVDVEGTHYPEKGIYDITEVKTDADLIIIQRPLRSSMYYTILQAKKQGIAVVVELDDDFHSVPKHNVAYKDTHPKYNPDSNYLWLERTCALADVLTVSTPALLKNGTEGRRAVIPNYVPESIFDLTAQPSFVKRSLGWTGTIGTHGLDLQQTQGAISTILKKTDATFNVVGDGWGVSEALGIEYSKVNPTGWVDIDKYYQTMLNHISVGIVPLEDNEFNRSKSHLKGMEMAALGIPFVASPSAEYVQFAKEGLGVIASTKSEWEKAILGYLNNPRKTTATANRYRKLIKEHYTYEKNAELWADAWKFAVDHRRDI